MSFTPWGVDRPTNGLKINRDSSAPPTKQKAMGPPPSKRGGSSSSARGRGRKGRNARSRGQSQQNNTRGRNKRSRITLASDNKANVTQKQASEPSIVIQDDGAKQPVVADITP